jgi:hypothetical protein
MKRSLMFLSLAVALSTPGLSAAASDTDAAIAALEARMQALEADAARLRAEAATANAELQAARAEIDALKQARAADPAATAAAPAGPGTIVPVPEPAVAPVPEPAPVAAGGGDSANAFNPAISLVLAGEYAHHSLDPEEYARAGFPLVGEGGPGEQGLALGESELALSANIDDKFYGQVTVALESEDGEVEVGIEEAYVDTTALPAGFALRMGRFFSNIGYLNNHHAHTDWFSDRPLPYQAFLGGHYGDDGVQLRWIAPTDLYVELGGELLRGASYPAGGDADGVGARTLFAHVGGDVGDEHSWLAGLSVLDADTVDGEDGFTGDVRLLIADATWKWAPDGNTRDGGLQLRTEWFFEDRDGAYADAEDPALDQRWDGARRGAYVEGVWRFDRTWETGYRYDRLWADDDGPYASDFDPNRHSVMLAWHGSEFSLLRLMLSRDRTTADDTDNVVSLQYQMALGAHGAHKF